MTLVTVGARKQASVGQDQYAWRKLQVCVKVDFQIGENDFFRNKLCFGCRMPAFWQDG